MSRWKYEDFKERCPVAISLQLQYTKKDGHQCVHFGEGNMLFSVGVFDDFEGDAFNFVLCQKCFIVFNQSPWIILGLNRFSWWP